MSTDREQRTAANRARLLAGTFRPPAAGSVDAIDDRLRSSVCGRCGYDLSGLPAAGACPECGRPFGRPEVLLYGYAAAGSAGDLYNRPPTGRQLAWRWAWSVPVLAFFAWSWHQWRFLPSFYGWFITVPFGLAVATWRGLRPDPATDRVQVRLTPAGARVLLRGIGPVPYEKVDRADLTPWRAFAAVHVRPETDGLVRVTLTPPRGFWPTRRAVDAVVRCDPAAVDVLAVQVQRWWAAGSVTAPAVWSARTSPAGGPPPARPGTP